MYITRFDFGFTVLVWAEWKLKCTEVSIRAIIAFIIHLSFLHSDFKYIRRSNLSFSHSGLKKIQFNAVDCSHTFFLYLSLHLLPFFLCSTFNLNAQPCLIDCAMIIRFENYIKNTCVYGIFSCLHVRYVWSNECSSSRPTYNPLFQLV